MIKDNSSNNDSLILVDSGSTLILDNLTLEGGLNGVYGTRNSNVLFDNVNINNFTNRGISIHDSSYLGVDEGGVKIQGDNAEKGILLSTGSSGWIYNAVILNVKKGIEVRGGAMSYIKNFDITGGEQGISVSDAKLLKYDNDGTGLGTISETSDRAIGVYDSIFKNWDPGKLEIRNLTSGRGIDIDRSTVEIRHLEMIGLDSSDENVLELRNSNFNLRNINISNSGRNGINIFGSSGYLDNISSTNNQGSGLYLDGSNVDINNIYFTSNFNHGIEVKNNSRLSGGWKDENDSSMPDYMIIIKGNSKSGIYSSKNSSIEIQNAHISSNNEHGIEVKRNSYLSVDKSFVESNKKNGISLSRNSYLDIRLSIVQSNLENGIVVRKNSILDFGGDSSNTTPILVSNNNFSGIDTNGTVIIEFDEEAIVQINNNNGSLTLGEKTFMSVGDAILNVDQEINCWSHSSKDPTDNSITQESEKPIIEFNYTTGLPQISSNCRIITPNN